MKLLPLLVASASPAALAFTIPRLPSVGDLLSAVDQVLYPATPNTATPYSSLLTIEEGYNAHLGAWGHICSLKATPEGEDDTDNIEQLFKRCGRSGVITLPSPVYNITRPLTIRLESAVVKLQGFLKFAATDLDFWIRNAYVFPFQDQRIAFIIEGSNFVLSGGGIDGSGQAWYDWAAGEGNKHGRPISLALKGVRNAVISHFDIVQPQFWAHLVWDSQSVQYTHCTVNATNFNPDHPTAPEAHAGLQNTDGINTYNSHAISISDFVYQGGDDCIALKANSSSIAVSGVRCHGGAGIAFGSVGQYPGTIDIIKNVAMSNLRFAPSSQDKMYHGVYFKNWVGVPSGTPPNGGGGGTGWCKNVSISNVELDDVVHPLALTSSLTYLDDEHGKYKDTSTFAWSHMNFTHWSGTSTGNRVVWLDCSAAKPCHAIKLKHMHVTPGKDDNDEIRYVCNNVEGLRGTVDCHPNDSTDETDAGGTV